MKKIALTLSVLLTAMLGGGASYAQAVGTKAQVVSACGTSSFSQFINGQQNYVPFTILPNGLLCVVTSSGGSGGGGSSGPVYGPDAQGNSPTQPPVLAGLLDTSGKVRALSSTYPAPIAGSVSVLNFPATQPVSGTVTANQGGAPWATTISGTLPAFAATPAFNLSQLAGTTVATGAGASNAGTLRVILSTDSPGGTGGGTSSFAGNITQFGGSNVVTGTGASGVGIPRVTVSSDSFPSIQPVSGTVTANQGNAPWSTTISGTLPAFASTPTVNISPSLNANGQAKMAASSPVVIASDQSSIPVLATLASGSSVSLTGTLPAFASTPTFNIGTGLPSSYPDATADAVLGTTSDTAYAGSGSSTVSAALRGIYSIIASSNQTPLVAQTSSSYTPIGDVRLGLGSSLVSSSNPVPVTVTNSTSSTSTTAGPSAPGTAASNSDQIGGVYNTTLPTMTNGQQGAIQTDANGRVLANIASNLNTNGQAKMAASSPVAIASDQSAIPVTGTFFQPTQPVSATTLPLPTGAATAAGQSAQQGSVSPGTAATTSVLGGGVYNSSLPTLTSGQQAAFQFDSSGRLIVSGSFTASSSPTAGSSTGGTAATSSDQIGGVYNSTLPTLTSGQQAAAQLDSSGRLFANISPSLNTNGAKTSANSSPVVIASDQSTIPVSTTNGATSANQPTNAASASTTSGQTGTLGYAAASTAAPSLTTAQSYPLSLTLAGALRVDNSAVTQPVSGSVTSAQGAPAAASNAWPVYQTVGGAAASTANPLPVSVAGPLGAAQGATAAVGVVQQDGISQTLNASSAAVLSNALYSSGSIPTAGYGTISFQITSIGSGNTVVYEQSNDQTNWINAYGNAVANFSGQNPPNNTDNGIQTRVFPISMSYFRIRVSTYGSGTVSAVASLKAGPSSNNTVYAVVGNSPTLLQGAGIPAKQSDSWAINPNTVSASGGLAFFSRIPSAAASTNLTQAKSTAGRVYKILACNTTTTSYRIKFYNALAANVTVGTTTPLFTRPLPAAAASGGLNCASYDVSDIGWYFSTAISYAITAGAADSDTTAPPAAGLTDISVEYQ